MSKYLILIYQDEAVARQAEGESISASYQEFQRRRGARGEFLVRLGRPEEALVAFGEALILTDNEAERRYLRSRIGEVTG